MLSVADLKRVAHSKPHSRKDIILLCLFLAPVRARTVAELRETASSAGIRDFKKWNFSAILNSLPGLVIRTQAGWELSPAGVLAAQKLAGVQATPAAVHTLRNTLPKLKTAASISFVEEAIGCVEAKHFRAAVVLSWVGALAVIYDHVIANCLAAFNAEAKRRDAKWKDAKSADDLSRMKEFDFLQVAEAISVIGKNVKGELEGALKLRNGCGHPNSLEIAEHKVASHVETLVLNVFAKF